MAPTERWEVVKREGYWIRDRVTGVERETGNGHAWAKDCARVANAKEDEYMRAELDATREAALAEGRQQALDEVAAAARSWAEFDREHDAKAMSGRFALGRALASEMDAFAAAAEKDDFTIPALSTKEGEDDA